MVKIKGIFCLSVFFSLLIFSSFAYSYSLPVCITGSIFCNAQTLNFDISPEPIAAPHTTFISANSSHNNTCSEKEIYRNGNVTVTNSILNLNFVPNVAPIFDSACNQNYTQTSGAVYSSLPVTKTANGNIILHGAISVIAKMPPIIPGIWPAIWLLPIDTAFTNNFINPSNGQSNYWPQSGEIDTIEMAGTSGFGNSASTFLTTLHFGNLPSGDNPRGFFYLYQNYQNLQLLSNNYHDYTLEWNITLKDDADTSNILSTNFTQLNAADIANIQINMYVDGQLFYNSIKRNWNAYSNYPASSPSCDNGDLTQQTPTSSASCGPNPGNGEFNIPDTIYGAFVPPSDDSMPLSVFTNGFNSGFRLIMNVASGGGIFSGTGDTQDANNGAQQPVTMSISNVTLYTINNLVFTPNVFHGGTLSWLPIAIPGVTIDHYVIVINGYEYNVNQSVSSTTTSFTIPYHTLWSNQNYTMQVDGVDATNNQYIVGNISVNAGL